MPTGWCSLSAVPDPNEADRPVDVARPLRLALEPLVVDQSLVQLRRDEPGGAAGREMFTEDMDVRLDRERLTVGSVEMRRHAGVHDEERVVPDDDELAARSEQSARLG